MVGELVVTHVWKIFAKSKLDHLPQTFDLENSQHLLKKTTQFYRRAFEKSLSKLTFQHNQALVTHLHLKKCGEFCGPGPVIRVSQTCHTSRRRFAPTERAPRCYHLGGWVETLSDSDAGPPSRESFIKQFRENIIWYLYSIVTDFPVIYVLCIHMLWQVPGTNLAFCPTS